MGTSARNNGTLVTLTHKGLENFDHLGADFKKENFQNSLGRNPKQSFEKFC